VLEVPASRNHTGFRYEPEAFAAEILKIFGEMEEKERMRHVAFGQAQ
jgi:hypothetical protein